MANITFTLDSTHQLFGEPSDHHEVSVSFHKDDPTWEDMTMYFLDFLRGCGFVLSDSEFEESFNQHANDYEEAISLKEDRCPCHEKHDD